MHISYLFKLFFTSQYSTTYKFTYLLIFVGKGLVEVGDVAVVLAGELVTVVVVVVTVVVDVGTSLLSSLTPRLKS